MLRVRNLLDKAVLAIALAAVLSGGSAFWIQNSSAATCTSTDGKATCSGECCSAGASGCAGGPCPKEVVPIDEGPIG